MATAQTSKATVMTRKASLNAMTNASRVTSDLMTAYDCLSAIVASRPLLMKFPWTSASIACVIKAHADVHITAHGENETTPANKQALIEPFHQPWQKRKDQKLRQTYPDQHFADLQRAVTLNSTEIERDQKNGTVKCQTKSKSDDRDEAQIAARQETQIHERFFADEFDNDEKRNEYRSENRAVTNERAAEPVLSLTLLKHGDKRAESDGHAENSPPISSAKLP